ncbi:hypothetical protein BJ965_002494 [Streptomyces luteogriseus]|uniref:Uncharacterized protein n=1 Tax=Streptomyces luteogriseus TaxID=68233 RepID=A0A7W7DL26_9ACTN|nr:hypothetical protein [Streptomyces luteogriseus]
MSPSRQGRGELRAGAVPNGAGMHGKQPSLNSRVHASQCRSAAGQQACRAHGTRACQVESASSTPATRSMMKPQVTGLVLVRCPAPAGSGAPQLHQQAANCGDPRFKGRVHVCRQDHYDRSGGRSTDLGPVSMGQRACPWGGIRPERTAPAEVVGSGCGHDVLRSVDLPMGRTRIRIRPPDGGRWPGHHGAEAVPAGSATRIFLRMSRLLSRAQVELEAKARCSLASSHARRARSRPDRRFVPLSCRMRG